MKYAAASLILLTLLMTWAGVRVAMDSTTFAGRVGAFLPAALTLWMANRVTREYYQT
jgi:hypothetical protein